MKMLFVSDVSLLIFHPVTLSIAEDRTLRIAAIELSILLVFNSCVLRLSCSCMLVTVICLNVIFILLYLSYDIIK